MLKDIIELLFEGISMTPNDRKIINMAPTKDFFINTLVKDIDLIDAILDLIDNSIDNHIRNNYSEKKKIIIQMSEETFIIEDNCGGIPKKEVYDHIFRLGKSSEDGNRTIGVYGIGLKRALFKMGTNILIESDDGNDYFSIIINEDWIRDEEKWGLEFHEERESEGNPYLKITISDLYPNISEEMGTTTFENELLRRIQNTYSIFISERVDIEVNSIEAESFDFLFLNDSNNFSPFHKFYNVDDVSAEIFAGFTPIERRETPAYGWYVFCNDRLILRNDTSSRTGWGGYGERQYHYPEDNRFLGLIFFRSDNPKSLPWQTTKNNVHFDSRIYKSMKVEMTRITKGPSRNNLCISH